MATPATMLQVVASGLQDRERLNTVPGKPSIQHYTFLMRKRTRWASQWRRIEFDNIADFGRTATCTLPIEGELITRATLVVDLPDISGAPTANTFAWTNAIGHALCVNTQFLINGEVVDEIDSRLLEVLDEQSPIEHFTTTNTLIGRNPSSYSDLEPRPSTVAVTPPFWWNRGPGPQALPIRALYKDQIQLRVTFRDFAGSIYTSSRNADGSMVAWPADVPSINAYWIVEYVSLEDREAAAYRCDMEIPFEQHVAVPPQPTNGNELVRIRLDETGLVRDLTWVAQRVEATEYNAYFLFTRDLCAPTDPSGSIWWPNAVGVSETAFNYGRGRIIPAFATAADPILQAKMTIRGLMRFEHEAALFRSLLPALNCARTPLVDRFIYRYDFGYWPTGGLTDALDAPVEIRGCANWDVLPTKELLLQMNVACAGPAAFYIYAWITRYNRLRIINGHGAVLFT